ncbi:MAG: hypothetical protein ACI39U_05390, partial [Candidatus Cryptobacteroides sp.]
MATPIWRDWFVDIPEANQIFEIRTGGLTIYRGRAQTRPGKDYPIIRINDICADFLQGTFRELSKEDLQEIEQPPVFDVFAKNEDDSWEILEGIDFLNDWSYDVNYDPVKMGLSFPVKKTAVRGQYFLCTVYNKDTVEVILKEKNGDTVTIEQEPTKLVDAEDFEFFRAICSAGSGTFFAKLGAASTDIESISVDGIEYKVLDPCPGDYVLYYLNAYGGWDSLLLRGVSTEEDEITRYTKEVVYDNSPYSFLEIAGERATRNYLNEIKKKRTLHTGWLSDVEAGRMHHLTESTDIYIHDIVRNEIYPVVIESTTHQFKTYKNNGCKLVNYDITVKLAQNRER